MACNTGCQDVAGIPPQSARPAGRPPASCMGGYCDDGLAGLPESQAVDLVGVPAGDTCLHRVDAIKGVWQHDPNHPGGSDFVGALDRLQFLLGERVASGVNGGFGKIPILLPGYDAQGKASLEVVPQDVGEGAAGFLNVLRQDQCGDLRQDKLVPPALEGCPDNLFLLGMVKTLRTCGNQEYVDYAFKELSKLIFPSGQLATVTQEQLSDGALARVATWLKSGDCWELGLGPNAGCSYLTAVAVDEVFDSLTVCAGGVTKKLTATEGKTIVGTAEGKWALSEGVIGMVFQAAASIFSSTTVGNQSAAYLLTGAGGYLAKYTAVQLRFRTRLSSFDGDALLNIKVNGETRSSSRVRGTGGGLITDGDGDYSSEWVKIPTDKTLNILHEFSFLGGGTSMELVQSEVFITAWS